MAAFLGAFALAGLSVGPAAAESTSINGQQVTIADPSTKFPSSKINVRKGKPPLPVVRRLVRAGGPIGENLIGPPQWNIGHATTASGLFSPACGKRHSPDNAIVA